LCSIGPIEQYHNNSKYYSAVKPRANKLIDENLPHVTIQMPVYKESLETVLAPSFESLKKAMQTYARQGGTSTIFVNDDGMRLLSDEERDTRIAYYADHNIGWVARPKHDGALDGYKRAGRFKKASNMNYGLALSLKAEKHLENLMQQEKERPTPASMLSPRVSDGDRPQYGMQYQNRDADDQGALTPQLPGGAEDLEEKALQLAIEEVYEASGRRWRPWAANGKSCRLGEIILIVDSDTIVPEDCFRDAARELAECPTVAIIQHESDVMQVAHHYFENGIAYFTRRINRCISLSEFFLCGRRDRALTRPQLARTARLRPSSATMRSSGGVRSRTRRSSTPRTGRRRSGPSRTCPRTSTWRSACRCAGTSSAGRRTRSAGSRRACR
jgi:cellulose synthase/poly-beta-1,6-N-acetylglucosamine synthase-like glycosyltransferase